MEPLHVVARVPGPIALPGGPIALDALLCAAVARRDGLPQIEDAFVPIQIPVELAPGGRFHLASFSESSFVAHDRHWLNRRFPVAEAQAMGNKKLRRIALSTGPCKSYRIPLEVGYLAGERIDWWCIGDAAEIRSLLSMVTHLGKKRSVGKGEVASWTVEPCEPWPGFPVLRDGRPLRSLPLGWPGIGEHDVAHRVLGCAEGPYWQRHREETCACPVEG